VLQWLADQGIDDASATMYADGSGRLEIPLADRIQNTMIVQGLGELLHSRRWTYRIDGSLEIMSCQGWHP
jgi:hypothetical protein